jgi:hypothetical protein
MKTTGWLDIFIDVLTMANPNYKNSQLLSLNVEYYMIIANTHFVVWRIHYAAHPSRWIVL